MYSYLFPCVSVCHIDPSVVVQILRCLAESAVPPPRTTLVLSIATSKHIPLRDTVAQLCSTLGTRFVVFLTREASVEEGGMAAAPGTVHGRITLESLRAVLPKVSLVSHTEQHGIDMAPRVLYGSQQPTR